MHETRAGYIPPLHKGTTSVLPVGAAYMPPFLISVSPSVCPVQRLRAPEPLELLDEPPEDLLLAEERELPPDERLLPPDDRLLPADERALPPDDRLLPADERELPPEDRLLPADERAPAPE